MQNKNLLHKLSRDTSNILGLIVLLFVFLHCSCSAQKKTQHTPINLETEKKYMQGSELSYKVFGEGEEVMLLLHGLGSNEKAWNKLLPLLGKEFTVYVIDFPKFLDSDDKSKVGISNYATMLSQFIRNLNIGGAHLVGHSMGGQIALKLSLLEPKQVKSLALLAPAGLETFSASDRKWFQTWITKNYYLTLSDEAVARSFDINFNGNSLPKDAEFMLEDRLALKADSVKYGRYIDYVLMSIESMLSEPVFDDLHMISVPTLVLFGTEDQLIPNQILHRQLRVEDVLSQANSIPKSETYLVDNAGHFIQWDQPEDVASKLSIFLKNNFTNE